MKDYGVVDCEPDVEQWREVSARGVTMSHRIFTVHRARVLSAWWSRQDEKAMQQDHQPALPKAAARLTIRKQA